MPSNSYLLLLAAITLAGAGGAVCLRNLVHCALSLTVAFGGLALLYLHLGAQFVGLVQLLVYVGAVAILIVFAILLTRGSEPPQQPVFSGGWISGLVIAGTVFAVLAGVILASDALPEPRAAAPPVAPVKDIGNELMTRYILPLEVIGLLLTAALIGAVVIAMKEKEP